jgi:outer membrane protein OmpA-like peptidoglycan-associated protein
MMKCSNPEISVHSIGIVAALAGLLALPACAADRSNAPPPEPAEIRAVVNPPELPEYQAREIHLDLGADLQRCDVESPHFANDETKPLPQEIPKLRDVASCLSSEPYAGYGVILVGRTDQHGSDDYNEKLGRQRAMQIKQRLVSYGVNEERILITSEGEDEAIGHKPYAADGYDRRVDIVQLTVVAP